jgi:pyruvate kinase
VIVLVLFVVLCVGLLAAFAVRSHTRWSISLSLSVFVYSIAFLEKGSNVVVTVDTDFKDKCDASIIYVDYERMPNVIKEGDLIYIDDGLISLKVDTIEGHNINCIVQNAGPISSHKGVNLPNVDVDLPAVSEKDRADLLFGVKNKVDMVFASFIRKKEDVLAVKEVLGDAGRNIMVISKIENHEGMRNFDEILKVTDGIMVARGDLGIEIPAEKVFIAQKMMIARANLMGKPIICATQMLESMTVNPRPTRAEASDVANAVIDGADCVMLSGETAKGKYPLESVKTMSNICKEAEGVVYYGRVYEEMRDAQARPVKTNESTASSAVNVTLEQGTSAIIVLTKSGTTARLTAKYRPRCPIIAITRDSRVARQMQLLRGVIPFKYEQPAIPVFSSDVDMRVHWGMHEAVKRGMLVPGDQVVVVQGWDEQQGHTNTMRVLEVPDDNRESSV